jgi:hypothetical protein
MLHGRINAPDRGGEGLPAKEIQQRLGHSAILLTMDTYGHLVPPDKDAHERHAERALLYERDINATCGLPARRQNVRTH